MDKHETLIKIEQQSDGYVNSAATAGAVKHKFDAKLCKLLAASDCGFMPVLIYQRSAAMGRTEYVVEYANQITVSCSYSEAMTVFMYKIKRSILCDGGEITNG